MPLESITHGTDRKRDTSLTQTIMQVLRTGLDGLGCQHMAHLGCGGGAGLG